MVALRRHMQRRESVLCFAHQRSAILDKKVDNLQKKCDEAEFTFWLNISVNFSHR